MIYMYADEAGNFDFSRNPRASKYFILTTVTMTKCGVAVDLLNLRRELSWSGFDLSDKGFHACEDLQAVRDEVFQVIGNIDFRVDATILEKSKAHPQTLRPPGYQLGSINTRFYQYAWYYHFKHVGPRAAKGIDKLHVTAASIGTRKQRSLFNACLHDVVQQSLKKTKYRTSFWPASIDPCLQIADYCCWAIQRKWEMGDCRSYDLIRERIVTEFDLFRSGNTHYY